MANDESKINQAREKRRKVIHEVEEALLGTINPLSVSVSELTNKVGSTRVSAVEGKDIHQGVSALGSLSLLRSRQDDLLQELAQGKTVGTDPYIIRNRQLLNSPSALEDIGLAVARKMSSPVRIMNQISREELIKYLIEVLPSVNVEVTTESVEEESRKIESELLHEERLREHIESILGVYREIRNVEAVPLLDFVIEKTYSESLLKLEAVSYLLSSGRIGIVSATSEQKPQAGMYILSYEKRISLDEHRSFLLGLTHEEWQMLWILKEKGELEKRQETMFLG